MTFVVIKSELLSNETPVCFIIRAAPSLLEGLPDFLQVGCDQCLPLSFSHEGAARRIEPLGMLVSGRLCLGHDTRLFAVPRLASWCSCRVCRLDLTLTPPS